MSLNIRMLLGAVLWLACTLPVAAKGTLAVFQITGDQAYRDDDLAFEIAVGHAKASLDRQDADLEADQIVYDGYTNIVQADGHVRIERHGELTTGARFAFKLDSDEYLVTDVDVLIPHEHDLVSRQNLTNAVRDQLRLNALATMRERNKIPRFCQLHATFLQNPDSQAFRGAAMLKEFAPSDWQFHDPQAAQRERISDFSFPLQWHYGIFSPNNVFDDLDRSVLDRFLHGSRDSYRGFDPF